MAILSRGYKYFLLTHKLYFDTGLGLTNYFKYVIAFIGLASNDVKKTLIAAIIYAIICYILGYIWIKKDMATIDNDVKNQFNPFVKETLKHLSKNKKFK